jgi:hypothetical protein
LDIRARLAPPGAIEARWCTGRLEAFSSDVRFRFGRARLLAP